MWFSLPVLTSFDEINNVGLRYLLFLLIIVILLLYLTLYNSVPYYVYLLNFFLTVMYVVPSMFSPLLRTKISFKFLSFYLITTIYDFPTNGGVYSPLQ